MIIRRRDNDLIDLSSIMEGMEEKTPPAAVMKSHPWTGHVPQGDGAHRKMKFVVGDRERQSVKAGERVPMLVNLKVLDHHWSKDKDYYVPKGGEDVPGRRRGVERHLARGHEVDMPRLSHIDEKGVVSIGDGRHRLAVMRDRGMTHAPVLVPHDVVGNLHRAFHQTHERENQPGSR